MTVKSVALAPVSAAIERRPGCATLTVGRETVTLDPLLPADEFERRKARWDELASRAFRKI
jgi:hypothetical protein